MPLKIKDKCIFNHVVIDIIKEQYKNRSKVDVSNFIKELMYQDVIVQELVEEYNETMDDNLFYKLIYYLGLTNYLK